MDKAPLNGTRPNRREVLARTGGGLVEHNATCRLILASMAMACVLVALLYGTAYTFVLGRSWVLAADAGIATARRLTFADGKTELQAWDVGSKPYAAINLRFSFSKLRPWEGQSGW